MFADRTKVHKRWIPGLVGFFERGLFAPVLLSIQPVLHLFSINLAELNFSEVVRSLLVSLFFGLLILGLAYLLLRDWRRASLAASPFIFLFFLFGDMAAWCAGAFGLGPARADLVILIVVFLLLGGWVWLLQKRFKDLASLNLYFNLLAVLFFINTGMRLTNYLLENGLSLPSKAPVQAAVIDSAESRPDIYYIILDAYGRQDILQAFYELDNSSFLNELSARGFYVADESSSNYIQTMLSLSSSFNMDYL
jgi:hypothetical protein